MELFRNRSRSKKSKNKQGESSDSNGRSSATKETSTALGDLGGEARSDEMDEIIAGVASNLSLSSPQSSPTKKPAYLPSTPKSVKATEKSLSFSPVTPGGTRVDHILDSDDDSDDIFMDDDDDDVVTPETWANGKVSGLLAAASKSPGSSSVGAVPKSSPSNIVSRDYASMIKTPEPTQTPKIKTPPSTLRSPDERKSDDSDDDSDESDDDGDSDDEDDDTAPSKNPPVETEKEGHDSDSAEDYTDDEDEGEDGYKPGGYHRVKLGEVYNQRYVVIKKLGWGHFSTVWMVKDRNAKPGPDEHSNGPLFYALKVQKSAEHYTEAAMDEVELLDCVASERKQCEAAISLETLDPGGVSARGIVDHSKHVATLHDSFFHTGPNGRHMCMVFSMLGCNLLSVIKAFNYRGIPIPAVKKMIKGVCMGLDFLHRKCEIIHTDLKPENILLQFPSQYDGDDEGETNNNVFGSDISGIALENSVDRRNSLTASIVELETKIKNPMTPPDERKSAMKKLKKKRDEAERRHLNTGGESQNDTDGDADKDVATAQGHETERTPGNSMTLSDFEMENILKGQSPSAASPNSETPSSPDYDSFQQPFRLNSKRGPKHSSFVLGNFSPRQSPVDVDLMRLMRETVEVSSPASLELESHESHQKRNGGIAEITFLLRAFTPEEELADNISAVLGGIPWNRTHTKHCTREWRCGIAIPKTHLQRDSRPPQNAISTLFRLTQRGRKDVDTSDRQACSDVAQLVSANLTGGGEDSELDELPELPVGVAPRSNRALPFSIFNVKFAVKSTFVVLSFLESRFPGLVFVTYKREEGSPQLDSIVFGPKSKAISHHPLAMKIKDDGQDPNSSTTAATSLFGFDLRLVKEFTARPTVTEDGAASFKLSGATMEKVSSWWNCRNPIQERVKSFMGVDPTSEMINLPLPKEAKGSNNCHDSAFKEGGKRGAITSPLSNPVSVSSTQEAIARASQQPDLKDVDVLVDSRAVVVDLGNACWTNRHFSEDIQTRQYRAPEVLIGSNYDTSADMWSLGCITFELLTGDLLFDPRAGDDYDRDEDHLAMFQELLGRMPKKIAVSGKYSKNFFDKKGNLKHIKQLKFWPVEDVLREKYHFSKKDAQDVSDFITPLLDFDPATRATALQALRSGWLKNL